MKRIRSNAVSRRREDLLNSRVDEFRHHLDIRHKEFARSRLARAATGEWLSADPLPVISIRKGIRHTPMAISRASNTVSRALVIDEPWIGMILSGQKTWEMRTKPTQIRGRIGLIRKGSGLVVGTAELTGCLAPLDAAGYHKAAAFHAIQPGRQAAALSGGWVVPWVLSDVRPLIRPVPYAHRSGAVVWVVLDEAVGASLTTPGNTIVATGEAISTPPSTHARAAKDTQEATGIVRLTGGNLRNGHIYLRAVEHLLPADSIGGPNSRSPAQRCVTVTFDTGASSETDIASDKMILRARAPVRDFFMATGAQEGDEVAITRTGPYALHVALHRHRPG